jgi:DNA-binding CsgD family transcriptional regulator
MTRPNLNRPNPLCPLTHRELLTCLQIANGMFKKEAAVVLKISQSTVEKHIDNAYRKLDVHSYIDLTKWLIANHFLDLTDWLKGTKLISSDTPNPPNTPPPTPRAGSSHPQT